ncbi:MAG: WYL domain-containing protein [Gemmatimonadaceae bacterium]|nr:WYL domain-containing protein [Gemmatimonadaceae bacterium]
MSSTAAEQLKRVLHLIPHLADGEEHSLVDIATVAGVTPDELLRDLGSICERFDAPGGFVDGVSILLEEDTVCVNASHFHRPMRLTMPELCALELGLTMLKRERTPAEQAPVERALARLRETISKVPTNDRHAGTRYADLCDAGCAEHLAILRAGVAEHHKLELRYRSSAATESTTRTIAPHALVFAEQMWYVVAAGDDSAMRFFRLDRVESVSALDDRFERDGNVGLRVQEAGRAFASDTNRRMTVRYSARIARWVAEREGKTLAADGSLVMEHPVADESWAVRHVLQYGADAELLHPPELRALVASRLEGLGAATR